MEAKRPRFRLRTWLTRWALLVLLLGQVLAALGVYWPAHYLLWSQAEQRQLQTIDAFWINRPEIMGGHPLTRLTSLRAKLQAQNNSPIEMAVVELLKKFPSVPGVGSQLPVSIWGPLFAEIAGTLAQSQSVRLFNQSGQILYSSGTNPGLTSSSHQQVLDCLNRGVPTFRRRQASPSEAYGVILYPMRNQGQVVGILEAVQNACDVRRQLTGLALILIFCNALVFLVGIRLLYWLADRVCTPLESLAENTRRLGQGQLSERTKGNHDLYELSELAGAFDQAADRLQASFESQARFVADASHELKTPLTTLSGMAEILEISSSQESPDRQKASRMIGQQVERMNRLVSDLLLLSQPGGELIEQEPVALADLLEDLVDGASMFAGRNHTIECTCSPEARVAGPETRLQRIFGNLLDNALQHGRPQGNVWIRVEVQGAFVEAVVEDDGPGISEQDLPHLGERFYRPDRSRQRGTGGSGLGLAIVKSLVESLDGSLRIESQLNRGTRVLLRLPNL